MTRFETNQYQFSHGHQPRGYGCWAFEFAPGQPEREVWLSPPMLYGQAKNKARAMARRFGRHAVVSVLP